MFRQPKNDATSQILPDSRIALRGSTEFQPAFWHQHPVLCYRKCTSLVSHACARQCVFGLTTDTDIDDSAAREIGELTCDFRKEQPHGGGRASRLCNVPKGASDTDGKYGISHCWRTEISKEGAAEQNTLPSAIQKGTACHPTGGEVQPCSARQRIKVCSSWSCAMSAEMCAKNTR